MPALDVAWISKAYLMALPFRISRASRAQTELALFRGIAGAAFAILGYIGCTTDAVGPQYGTIEIAAAAPVQPQARLVRNGDEVLITGSISGLFDTGGFLGPNRAEKVARARPEVDVLEIAQGFAGMRSRLAELRMPRNAPAVKPPVRVASLVAPSTSAALDAIDEAAPGEGAPLPRSLSEKLAYARADAPLTIFDGTVRDRNGKKVSAKELNCLATAIYFEARGESERGQIAVGQVVLNRVAHKLYPSTICSVVFQNQHRRNACQFSFACDGMPERVSDSKSWETAERIANGVAAGDLYLTEIGYSTHYHATYVYPHWAPRMTKVTKIGLHVFYHFKRGWKFG
jgi:spore germination cell wall hydrolase CwlJ-like protein